MPSARSARVQERRHARNAPLRSRAKTLVNRARKLAEEDGGPPARAAAAEAVSALDRAAKKGAIHSNNASRRKSRLMKLINRSDAE